MNNFITTTIQDYLKTIYTLTLEGKQASTTALAARLNLAPASVTGMLKKLAGSRPPLINYKKHRGAQLTRSGERAALEVIRHHRLLEAYLVKELGYSWDAVHEEACRLEHVISEDFEARIATSLGHPTHDPHGDPIPSADLVMPTRQEIPLDQLRTGQKAVIRRVSGEDPTLLRHLEGLGLVPGARVTIKAYSSLDGNLTVETAGHPASVFGPSITRNVFVEE